jgi:uncharacterized DUF497 family protein
VDFTTAQEALADPPVLVLFAAAHRDGRGLRGWLLGRIGARILLVRYTHRPDGVIRLIGAGDWREGRDYDENHWKKRKPASPAFDAGGDQTNLAALNGTPLPNLASVKVRPPAWGGTRAGAGRKPSGPEPMLLRLTPRIVRQLRATARKQGKTVSDVVEERLALA